MTGFSVEARLLPEGDERWMRRYPPRWLRFLLVALFVVFSGGAVWMCHNDWLMAALLVFAGIMQILVILL